MKSITISLKTLIITILIIFLIIMYLINFIFIKFKQNNIKEINTNNTNIINTEKNAIDPELLKNMQDIAIIYGLGSNNAEKNKQKVLIKNEEFYVTIDVLQKMISNNVKVTYNESEKTIKAFFDIPNYEDINTFLVIDLENGIMKGRRTDGTKLEDEQMEYLPIVKGDTILLPMKTIISRVHGVLRIHYDEERNIIRWKLKDYELDFLNNFPKYNVIKITNTETHYQSTNIFEKELIFENNGKYGLATYKIEEIREENKVPGGKYLGYDILLDPEYDEINFIEYDYKMYILRKDDKSFIYETNKTTSPEEYDSIEKLKCNGNYYKIKKNNKYGIYNLTEIIYDDIWYEEGKKTNVGTHIETTECGIFGLLNGEKVLIKELQPIILMVD